MAQGTTREQLLDAAERLVRTRGYSAISYADLAQAVGIRKASIHHHFPAKADLGAALTQEYAARFAQLLDGIDRDGGPSLERLRRYADIYAASVEQGMLCLCGMLVTELQVLPEEVQAGVRRFFAQQLAWLRRVLADGAARGELTLTTSPEIAAERSLSALEGATLVAWGTGDPAVVTRATNDLIATLSA
ncbi:MAG: TetR/AcrR family transcriptional regulator [Alphaproteobacteria bacterium]|nr:MAG: TetR/AcrR family transcriptional regulator [Alphaproteobacteria bacterium]